MYVSKHTDKRHAYKRTVLLVKSLPAMQETLVGFLAWEDPQRRKWPSTPVLFPGEFHGQRSLVLESMGSQESDMTEWLTLLFYTTVRKSIDPKGERTIRLFQKNGHHWRKLGGTRVKRKRSFAEVFKQRTVPQFSSVQFSCSVVSNSSRPHGLQYARPPGPSPTPRVHPNSCPSRWWCHRAISKL